VLLWGAFRHTRRLFWVLAPFVLCIPFACVYLRYHYVVDILAGLLLFLGVTVATTRSRALQEAFRRPSSATALADVPSLGSLR
jgi:membrane-associated phospholipid phosphatase